MRVKNSEDLDGGDIYFLFDAGKSGNRSILISGFLNSDQANVPKQIRSIVLINSEDSIKERMQKVRGFTAINQVETVHMVSKHALKLTEHNRLHHPGTNRGNVIGPIALPRWDKEDYMVLPPLLKKSVFAQASIPVGGPVPGLDADAADESAGSVKGDHHAPPRRAEIHLEYFWLLFLVEWQLIVFHHK